MWILGDKIPAVRGPVEECGRKIESEKEIDLSVKRGAGTPIRNFAKFRLAEC